MFDWFGLMLIALVLLVLAFIVSAIRKTMREVTQSGVSGDEARKLAELIRAQDTRCPRCGRQSSALLGTEDRYKCDTCNHVFEGSKHIRAP